MKILIACEFSGVVRDAFCRLGHDAWSCDLLPSEAPGNHIQENVLSILDMGWDLMVAFPPCTYLAKSGNRWINAPGRQEKRQDACLFIQQIAAAPIPMIAIENPIGQLSIMWRRPDQIICPSMFGHHVTKSTCLWLKNMPPLMATVYDPFASKNWTEKVGGKNRQQERSRTFVGVADAMALQWAGKVEGNIS